MFCITLSKYRKGMLLWALASLCLSGFVPLSTRASARSLVPGLTSLQAVGARDFYLYGVYLSGAEFGTNLPGRFGVDYTYPDGRQLDYYGSRGMRLVRLPFRWERMQRALYAPLDPQEAARMDAFLLAARQRGIMVIVEAHNNARYQGAVVGTSGVSHAAFADFWRRMAERYRNESALYGYDLSDEPHDTGGRWIVAAQAAIDGIRRADPYHAVVVGGECWSSTTLWRVCSDSLKSLRDPAGNLLFDAHVFFDRDGSGKYRAGYDAEGAYPDIGVDRTRPFLTWLRENRLRGIVGGYGVPGDDPRWLEVLLRFMRFLDANHISGTAWGAGPWWGSYHLSLEPRDGRDSPQMRVLTAFRGGVALTALPARSILTYALWKREDVAGLGTVETGADVGKMGKAGKLHKATRFNDSRGEVAAL